MIVTHPQQAAENKHDPPQKLNFEYCIFITFFLIIIPIAQSIMYNIKCVHRS